MSKKEKLFLAILAGWITTHIILFLNVVTNKGCWNTYKGNFWPIDSVGFSCSYDKTEFYTYVITPIVVFVVYYLLKLIKTK